MISRLLATTFLIALSLVSCRSVGEAQEKTEGPVIQPRSAKLKEMYDRLQPVHLYGKVVDENGNAVVGADVDIGWESADLLIGKRDSGRTTSVSTDDQGFWEFTIEKPHRAYVQDVRKASYEYSTRYNEKSWVRNLVESRTTRNEPTITILRKKGETRFLIVRPGVNLGGEQLLRVLSPNSKAMRLDLTAEKGEKPSIPESYADLYVSVDYGQTTGKWTVTYSASDEMSGIIICDDLLYEAPQDGYHEKLVVNGPPWPKYLYVRSRNPAIYSRLDLEHSSWKESEMIEGFKINYTAWVNPYGERNLEYEIGLEKEWRLADRLEHEAKTMLHQNKRPPIPDLQKLLTDARSSVMKGK